MLNIVRRGRASVAVSLVSSPYPTHCVYRSYLRGVRQCIPQIPQPLTVRTFRSTASWKQYATATASYEDEAIEGEIEQEVSAPKPPSDRQVERATQTGPVTKFKDLAERGLVSQTVVDTITKDMGLETMTQVQSLTLNESLKGTDM